MLTFLWIRVQRRRALLEQLVAVLRRSPTPRQLLELLLARDLPIRLTLLRQPIPGQEGPIEDKRRRPFRIRRCEQRSHRRALRIAEHGRPFGTHGIHDRANIVHPRLQIRHPTHPIGKSGSALVEDDQAAEGRQPPIETLQRRLFPPELDIRNKPRRKDEIERPIPKHLIGNRHIAASRITRLRPHRQHLHARLPTKQEATHAPRHRL